MSGPRQFILKDGQEEGIYPGLGVAKHGEPLTAYGTEQEEAFKADPRFKAYTPPAEDQGEPKPKGRKE